MDKKKLERRLSEQSKGALFISENRLRGALGLGQNKVVDLMDGVEFIKEGCNGKKYFIPDVVERIAERIER